MDHGTDLALLQDFAVVLLAAAGMGWGARRLGLSSVAGYLIAGILIGPHVSPFPYITDLHRVHVLSQLGLVFLMFFVGLQLSFDRIRRLGASLIAAAILETLIIFHLAQLLAFALGWSWTQGLFLAAIFQVSSSAVITKVQSERGVGHERFSQRAIGVTLLEDIVAVLLLAVLGTHAGIHTEQTDFAKTLGLLGGFAVLTVSIGLVFVPKVLRPLGRGAQSELASVFVAGTLFAVALLAAQAGFSVALGAFLFGLITSETGFASRIERTFLGAQEMFSAMFFVSIGMLLDLQPLIHDAPLILAIACAGVLLRIFGSLCGLLFCGHSFTGSVRTALALAPIGEFSFVIAQMGVSSGAVPSHLATVAVCASLLSAAAAPWLIDRGEWIAASLKRLLPEPVLDAHSFYLERLTQFANRSSPAMVRLARRPLLQIGAELLFIAALLGFSRPLLLVAEGQAAAWQLDGPWVALGFWSLIAALYLALAVAVWRNIGALALILSEGIALPFGPRAQGVLETLLRLLGMFILVWVTWLFSPLPARNPTGALIVLALLVTSALLFRRRLVRWHSQFQQSLANAAPPSATRLLSEDDAARWGVELAEWPIPEDAAYAGQTIADLALRPRFGTTVVAVERQGINIPNPRPHLQIFPHDRLLLFGTEAALAATRQFLATLRSQESHTDTFPDTALDLVAVPDSSPRLFQSLVELQLFQQTGVQILGIQRDAHRILNPPGSESLHPGDRLLILAAPDERDALAAWLEPPAQTG